MNKLKHYVQGKEQHPTMKHGDGNIIIGGYFADWAVGGTMESGLYWKF